MLACSLFTTGSCAQVLHFSCFRAHPSSNKVSAKSVLLGDTHQHVSAADSMTLCGVVQTHTHIKSPRWRTVPCNRAHVRFDWIEFTLLSTNCTRSTDFPAGGSWLWCDRKYTYPCSEAQPLGKCHQNANLQWSHWLSHSKQNKFRFQHFMWCFAEMKFSSAGRKNEQTAPKYTTSEISADASCTKQEERLEKAAGQQRLEQNIDLLIAARDRGDDLSGKAGRCFSLLLCLVPQIQQLHTGVHSSAHRQSHFKCSRSEHWEFPEGKNMKRSTDLFPALFCSMCFWRMWNQSTSFTCCHAE